MRLIDTIETFISGDWGSESWTEETPCEVFCVRGADIEPIRNQDYGHVPMRYISNRSFENKLLQPGDIVVEKSGGSPTQSTGRVCLITPDLVDKLKSVDCSNFCSAFRVKPEWDAEYIYLYIQHIYNSGIFFNFEGKTSGIKNLQLEQAYQAIDIKPVPLAEQKKLARVIRTIDKKMAINREINQNLEALAKQLYDYWFVQFDFPNEEGKPYKSGGGKMVWNDELQMDIPEAWNVCRLSEFICKNNTGDWGADEYSAKTPIEVGCIRGADIVKLNGLPKRYIKESNKTKLLSEWDVVIEVSGGSPVQATGRSAFITPGVIKRNGGKLTCSNFCHAFSFSDFRYSSYFIYVWKMFYDNSIMFNYEGKTSGIKNFMTETFLANKWVKAPEEIAYIFFNRVKELYAKIDANIEENNYLIKQCGELLPLLMNGQVSLNSDLSAC